MEYLTLFCLCLSKDSNGGKDNCFFKWYGGFRKNNLKLSVDKKSCSILSKLLRMPEKYRVTFLSLYLLCRSLLVCYRCNYKICITWTAFPIFTCDISSCRSDLMDEINISLKLFAFLLDDKVILSDWANCFNTNYEFFYICKFFKQNENIYI